VTRTKACAVDRKEELLEQQRQQIQGKKGGKDILQDLETLLSTKLK